MTLESDDFDFDLDLCDLRDLRGYPSNDDESGFPIDSCDSEGSVTLELGEGEHCDFKEASLESSNGELLDSTKLSEANVFGIDTQTLLI